MLTRNLLPLTLFAGLALMTAGGAEAQVNTSPRPPDTAGPVLPAPAPNETLSDQLERNQGVIKPPRSPDSDMRVPPPAQGRTPVIPPQQVPTQNPSAQ